ncbi:MAG TPA: CAP domain-containing protein, partial [Acidimicrobiales bacterium]
MLALLVAGSAVVPVGPLGSGRAAAAPVAHDLASVENLYATDLLARVNAERAARTGPGQPIPALLMDAGLNAAAQAWANYIASTGVVQDAPLAGCGANPSPSQLCVLAANAGNSGNGFWPGDGSDGMESDYMNSTGHRQNMLNAGYDTVGLGVACSGGQAWTVELFGFTYGTLGPALSREAAQNAAEGNPVPPGPAVAGTNTGAPVYCPGQTMGPNGAVTPTGGQYPYPYPVPAVPGEPLPAPPPPPDPFVGMAAAAGDQGYWLAKADGNVSPHGSAPSYGSMLGKSLAAPITHIVGTPDGRGYWLVGADGGIFTFGDAGFYGSMGGLALNAQVVDMAPTQDGRGYWLVAR